MHQHHDLTGATWACAIDNTAGNYAPLVTKVPKLSMVQYLGMCNVPR